MMMFRFPMLFYIMSQLLIPFPRVSSVVEIFDYSFRKDTPSLTYFPASRKRTESKNKNKHKENKEIQLHDVSLPTAASANGF